MRAYTAAALTASLLSLAACSQPQPKVYNYPAWGFSVTFKTPPKVTETASTADSPHSIQAEATQDDVDLVVIALDSQTQGKSDEQLLAEVPDEMVRGANGTVKSQVNITLGKVAGRDLTIDRGADPTERARVFVVKGRIYQVVTQTPQGTEDTEATQFLNSFHLTGQ
jgi:hypothetical protein